MKISTIALGALLSFSVNAIAQDKSKLAANEKNTKSEKTKSKECSNQKNKTTAVDTSSKEPKHRSRKVCGPCGRG